jgi:hypothetical protein
MKPNGHENSKKMAKHLFFKDQITQHVWEILEREKNIEIVGWRVFLTRKYLLKNKRK